MSWNISFSRSLIFKFHNKLGIFHIVPQKNTKSFENGYGSQNLANLQNLDAGPYSTHFEWSLHIDRKKSTLNTGRISKTVDLEIGFNGKIVNFYTNTMRRT